MSRAGGYGMIGFYKSVAMGANLVYDSFFRFFCLLFYGHDGMGSCCCFLKPVYHFPLFFVFYIQFFCSAFFFIPKHRGF